MFHRKYNSNEEIKICDVTNNQTYMCYYSISENQDKLYYMINVKSANDTKSGGVFIKKEIKLLLRNKLKLQIGKFFNQLNTSFEGYIGPILLFNISLTNECRKNIFILKGSYEKMLFFGNINSLLLIS